MDKYIPEDTIDVIGFESEHICKKLKLNSKVSTTIFSILREIKIEGKPVDEALETVLNRNGGGDE